MKKLLLVLIAVVSSIQLHAYKIEVGNNTDNTDIQVIIHFKGDYPSHDFTLKPGKQRLIQDIPQGSPIKGGVKVKGLSGRGKGKSATYKPLKKGEKVDINVVTDNAGRINFDKELL